MTTFNYLLINAFYCFFIVTILGCSSARESGEEEKAPRPNIVFILADDLGWADLPVYGNGFNEDIIHQRRVKFYGEADRWDVLVRTDKVFEVMEAHGERQRQNRPEVHVGDAAFRDIKILYPIPASAIQTDPNLKQNPEYQ